LKRLSHQFHSYQEVSRIIQSVYEERPKEKLLDIRVLEHLISYAEQHFGSRVPNRAYRKSNNGERIDNWKVEILILVPIYNELISVYMSDNENPLSMMDRNNLGFPYLEKVIDLLLPWSAHLDLNSTKRIGNLDKERINIILMLLSVADGNIAAIHRARNEYDLAENHYQRALTCARLYEGAEVEKTELLCRILRFITKLRAAQGNYAGAVIFAEECYDCFAIAYHPVHPQVQKAASTLIECLIHKGDMYNAERFAEATFDSLRDRSNGLDQQSEEVAQGNYDLANVIYKQKGDLMKAEMLVRESLRIRIKLYDINHLYIGYSSDLLASILMSQHKMGDETKELRERSLAIDIKHCGLDGKNTAVAYFNLGNFYHELADTQLTTETKMEHLYLSESKYNEALRIFSKILGPDNTKTIQVTNTLSAISKELLRLEPATTMIMK
jgi:tetratricopeptide (TPR) repeat protein